jgi:plasmid maintenance system killer protein
VVGKRRDQWRVCFVWDDGQVFDVEIEDYH